MQGRLEEISHNRRGVLLLMMRSVALEGGEVAGSQRAVEVQATGKLTVR